MRPGIPLFCLLIAAAPASAAQLVIDAGLAVKPVDHAASGALYGIAAAGWPPAAWIAGIAPSNFTQMAPGGGQLPNGETAPVGDALVVAPIAAAAGATVTIRMPDTFPEFPYRYRGDADWDRRVDAMVGATVAADPPNIYAWEIWNEPDWTWKPQWGAFDAFWARTHARIRAIDPERRIMGPSTSTWNEDWMRRFLVAAMASDTLPEVVSWHELDPAQAPTLGRHVAAYRALEAALGIGPLPISINEYGAPRDMAVPGALARLIARLERAGVDTAGLAFWHRPGRLADLLAPRAGGRGPARDVEPTGAYWLYQWYGGMSGGMLAVTPQDPDGETLDGFASRDGDDIRIVLGGEAGAHDLILSGLEDFPGVADIQAFATHWTGTDGGAPAPEPLFHAVLPVIDGVLTIPVALADPRDAVFVHVVPEAEAAAWTAPVPRFAIRLEAEDAASTGGYAVRVRLAGNFFANTVSADAYVRLLGGADTSLAFEVETPAAGEYRLRVGYANDLADSASYVISVNGGEGLPIVLTPTQGPELIDQAEVAAALPAGRSAIVLRPLSASAAGGLAAGGIAIDYLEVIAR